MMFKAVFQLKGSFVRRSLVVLSIMFPGFVLNYLLYFFVSRILPVEGFGFFYTSISILNILLAPAMLIGLFFTRRIADIYFSLGRGCAVSEIRELVKDVLRYGALGTGALAVALFVIRSLLGIDSVLLILLLSVTNYGNYMAETIRVGLQSLQMFIWLGVSSLTWMGLRFLFCLAGIYVAGTVWAGVLGIFASSIVVFVIFFLLIHKQAETDNRRLPVISKNLRELALFMASFSVYALIMYLDIIIAYICLDHVALSVYAASSVLPKSITLVLFPLCRILFPMMMGSRTDGRRNRSIIVKGFLVVVAVSGLSVAIISIFRNPICSAGFGVRHCNPDLMQTISMAAVPVCLLCIWILVQFSRNSDRHPMILIIPSAAFSAYAAVFCRDVMELAGGYVYFSWITLIVYSVLCFPRIKSEASSMNAVVPSIEPASSNKARMA